jgi:hypothetical protein
VETIEKMLLEIVFGNNKKMGGVGFEPTRISTLDLETNSFSGCAPWAQ